MLTPDSAQNIFNACSKLLRTREYSVRNVLKKMKVEVLCTTDDPTDNLQHHIKLREDGFEIKVLPTFRPDKAMKVNDAGTFNEYVSKLETASAVSIKTYTDYINALKKRHDFFAENGCKLSDHGLEQMCADYYTSDDINRIFNKLRSNNNISAEESQQIRSALLLAFAEWNHEKGWVQQFHIGALRNNNSRLMKSLGADAGTDSIGDFPQAQMLARFLDKLDTRNKLAKTILYNLNPGDNEMMATMAGNFNDGSEPGKIQYGAAWWFLDQKDGITNQLNALSNMGLLSRFVGMVTDSRSFLSFPRHEYFRRILCNLFGEEMERGELPNDIPWIGKTIKDICYNNAKNYFQF